MHSCVFLWFLVPTPLVQITTFNNDIFNFDNQTVGNETVGNLTIGDPLTLYCYVTAFGDISSSVDIIWTTGGRVVRRVNDTMADIEYDDSTIYTDSFEILSLSTIDNGREYQCTVVINTRPPVYSSGQITLIVDGEYICVFVFCI